MDVFRYHASTTPKNGEPSGQALQFQDGLLAVIDILNSAPETRSYHATDPGCSSGLTVSKTSKEPIGLVPALMYNGTSSVISTLWRTDDQDTACFTQKFYADFPKSPPRQCFTRRQRLYPRCCSILEQDYKPSPRYPTSSPENPSW